MIERSRLPCVRGVACVAGLRKARLDVVWIRRLIEVRHVAA